MKYIFGAIVGALAGLFVISVFGALYGANHPPVIACGKTVGPFFGGILGAIAFGLKFGLPTAGVGAVLGPIGACFWPADTRPSSEFYVNRPHASRIPGDQEFWAKQTSERVKRCEGQGIKPQ